MLRLIPSDPVEPVLWTLVFHRTAATWWLGAVAFGRFKHVSAYAYVSNMRVWLIYDVQFIGTRLLVLPDCLDTHLYLARHALDCEQVQMQRRPDIRMGPRAGLFCVTAIKHLLGLRCVVARPDALYRWCLRNGGVRIGPVERPEA